MHVYTFEEDECMCGFVFAEEAVAAHEEGAKKSL